jgi:hypothetical protein
MQTEQLEPVLELQDVDSDADFVLFCVARGLLSEHCTMREAQMALADAMGTFSLGEHLPVIYRRHEPHWIALR